MPVTLQQVRAQLDRDEPDYGAAAQLGPEALPQLMLLVGEGDPGLASKATYLAAFINTTESAAVVERASRSPETVVRVAAAGSLSYLKGIAAPLVATLLGDQDAGVRHLALRALEVHHPTGLKTKVKEIAAGDPDSSVRELANQIVQSLPEK